jgi:hypothetical protein
MRLTIESRIDRHMGRVGFPAGIGGHRSRGAVRLECSPTAQVEGFLHGAQDASVRA